MMLGCKDSMQRHKRVITKNLKDITDEIKKQAKVKTLNLALVLYRDKSCEVNRYTLPFGKDVEQVKKFIDEKCL